MRRPVVALPALVLAIGLAACSGDDASPAGTDVGSTAPSAPPASDASVAPSETSVAAPTESTSPGSTVGTPPTEPSAAAPDSGGSVGVGATSGYPAQPAGVPFPTETWPTGPLPTGVDPGALDDAVAVAFGADDAEVRVRSLVVVQGGQIVYERYHSLDSPEAATESYSVAKSFTSALIGMLVADGRMTLDEHPPRPEWSDPSDPRRTITIRNMLQMSSGLEWSEEYGPDSLAMRMLTAESAADVMAEQPLESDPGTVFEYSTGTTALLSGIAADSLGGCAQEIDYLNTRLLDPIGITTDEIEKDTGGCFLGGTGMNMTPRDFARFGLLYLRGGNWDGEQIIEQSWIDESRVPASTNPQYGLQWWLGGDGSFAAEGLFGQRIVVVPDADMVIVTTSTAGGDPYTLVTKVREAFAA